MLVFVGEFKFAVIWRFKGYFSFLNDKIDKDKYILLLLKKGIGAKFKAYF